MRTNLSQETLDLITLARKASICMMDPVIKEELVFRALIDMEHPLWLIMKNKFGLQEVIVKNLISDDLLKNRSDDPEDPANIRQMKEYFDAANREAVKDGSSNIEPYHMVRAIFLTEDNGIVRVFKGIGIKSKAVLDELGKISYSDLVKSIEKSRERKTYAPSRRAIRNTEDFYAGLQSDTSLTQFGRNLNSLAKEGKLDAVYFRDEEIRTTIEVLCRKQQNNPLLVGEAGVGKTAIVEGIAQLIVSGKVPAAIKDSQIIELSITSLVAGTTLRGQFEERIQQVIDACSKNPKIILFIDEIHMIVGAGGDKGVGDAANIFKPALARGGLRCIGATTTKENNQFIAKDKALKRRFQPVFVKEPTTGQTIDILNKCKERFEKFHKVKISDKAVKAAVEYADKYIKDRSFPGKAIDLLDHACAREKIDPNSDKVIGSEEIAMIIAKVAQVPITQILGGRSEELALLEERLKKQIIGQDEAVKRLVEVVQLTKMGMFIDMQKPEGVLLFVGPAGVGKTELAKTLAKAMLGDESRLVFFDMAEYKDASSVNKFIGASPGYIGYEQESRLVSVVRSNPNSIIAIEDIDKAHPDVLSLLQQIFDRGAISTQDGETISFSYTTFILISNLGAEILKEDELKGLNYEQMNAEVRKAMEAEVRKRFSPGFLNSIDKVIYFGPLKTEWLREIIRSKIGMVMKRLETKGYKIELGSRIEDLLLSKASSIRFGARYLNKVIENELLKPLSQYMLSCDKSNIAVSLDKDNKLTFCCK